MCVCLISGLVFDLTGSFDYSYIFSGMNTQEMFIFCILTDSVRKLHPISIRINMPPCFPFRTVCIDGISVFLVCFHLEETRKRKSDNPEGTRIFCSSKEWLICCAEPRGPHDERTVRESDLQQCLDTQKRC